MKPDAQSDHEARGQLIRLATDLRYFARLEHKSIELVLPTITCGALPSPRSFVRFPARQPVG